MLDVMVKALERAMNSQECVAMLVDISDRALLLRLQENSELRIDIARKASVIKAYERAWIKGQDDPYTNGRCAK